MIGIADGWTYGIIKDRAVVAVVLVGIDVVGYGNVWPREHDRGNRELGTRNWSQISICISIGRNVDPVPAILVGSGRASGTFHDPSAAQPYSKLRTFADSPTGHHDLRQSGQLTNSETNPPTGHKWGENDLRGKFRMEKSLRHFLPRTAPKRFWCSRDVQRCKN